MTPTPTAGPAASPFDLDITLVEQTSIAEQLDLTDDGCGTTCPKACGSAAN
jgi:FxLD family lantipeptide